MKFFVTGSAGFIGFHLVRRLLEDGHDVTGFDGLTPFFDGGLKVRRHAMLSKWARFVPVIGMLEDRALLNEALAASQADVIIHLAAQAGVRYSLDHPDTYISSNLVGTGNLLEAARAHRPAHLLFASTSSVYGANLKQPFAETDCTDGPLSLYGATKKSGEAMVHAYAHLWKIPTTCFRFFTVYGPWGRPDMALFKFVSAIEQGHAIDVYGDGRMRRDFTYINDLVEAVTRLMLLMPALGKPVAPNDSLSPVAPFRIVNVAGGHPVELMDFIETVEAKLGRTARKNMLPMQPGDAAETIADPSLLKAMIGQVPQTPIDQGIQAFVNWYRRDWAEVRQSAVGT